MMTKISVLAWLLPLAVLAAPTLSPEAANQYRDAASKVQAGAYGPATEGLNALAAQYPLVPEIFAARCSAQLGLRHSAAAEADCTYALSLSPNLPSALYGLAMAEDSQGKNGLASGHYRQYAALTDPQAVYKVQALARANHLDSRGPAAPLAPAPVSAPIAAPIAGQPSGPIGTLFVYRNHFLGGARFATGGGVSQISLYLDGQSVGDVGHDQFVEIQAAPGNHVLEARFLIDQVFRVPQVLAATVNLVPNGQSYLSFDTVGGAVQMIPVAAEQGRKEVTEDCKKAFTRRM